MIHIDPRSGSGELLPLFLSHRLAPTAQHTPHPPRDLAVTISRAGGVPTLMGIERKSITDMMSSIRMHRLAGEQVPKLLTHYEHHAYIVLEGNYRISWETGYLQHWRSVGGEWGWTDILLGKHPFHAAEMNDALVDICEKTPIKIWRTRDQKETVDWVVGKERYAQQDWERRHKHLGIHVPAPFVTAGKVSDVRRTAFAWEGIGWEKSGEVEKHFATVEQMVNAPASEWMKIPGFGKVLSTKTWNRLRGKFNAD
jgi:ERCC4-type nuclease